MFSISPLSLTECIVNQFGNMIGDSFKTCCTHEICVGRSLNDQIIATTLLESMEITT